jgi:hypothetical protein
MVIAKNKSLAERNTYGERLARDSLPARAAKRNGKLPCNSQAFHLVRNGEQLAADR